MVEHPILLRGLGQFSLQNRPTLLQRTDQELIPVLLQQLQAGGDLQPIAATLATTVTPNGTLKLYQPVQRMFAIALFEAVCVTPGLPRLDPTVIDSAGLVVRRLGPDRKAGWLAQQSMLRGWVEFEANQEEQDPEPARRRALSAGNALIDQRLALRLALTDPLAEQVTRLFVAPPEVCAALGKTVLYGLPPVTSSEFTEKPGGNSTTPLRQDYIDGIVRHLPRILRGGVQPAFPLANRVIFSADTAPQRLATDNNLLIFVSIMRQIAVEYAAFGPTLESKTLFAEFNTVRLPMPTGPSMPMGDFFKRCSDVLVERTPDESVTMPSSWPTLSEIQAQRIQQSIITLLTARLVASTQGERRFEDEAARYQLRGFVRVKRNLACPPELVWSEYSVPYVIAPWYEPADNGLPLPQISLPNPFDRAALRQLKPNVAFKVPEELFGLINGDMSKVIDKEEPEKGDGFGLDWICSFSLPIITLCAFLVLNIFLSLFDIIFHWMLFIKLCIPIPKKS